MSKKQRAARKPSAGKFVLAGAVVGIVVLAGLAVARWRPASNANGLDETDTAFSISTRVGQPAPAFTAIGVDGQPYTLTPGDGRPKAIVFYTGFG